MVKSIDRWMTVGEVRLEEKSGGKSGRLVRGEE
jgi:molybdenum cofactor biosynthesis enzyme